MKPLAENSPGGFLGRAISPKAPRLRCRTARRSVPTGEVLGRWLGLFRGLGILRGAPGVGRFLRKRRVCGADRSEIGPYRGGSRAMAGVVPRAWRSQGSSGGRAISPKAPRLRCRTARRSVPTQEVLGRWLGLVRGLGILRGAPGVGRFLRKRCVCGAGPLGDRSLPGRSSGESWGCSAGLAFSGRLPGVGRFLRKRHVCGADRSEIGPYLGGSRAMAGVGPWAWNSQGSSGGRAISPKAPRLRCRTARRSVPTQEVLDCYLAEDRPTRFMIST